MDTKTLILINSAVVLVGLAVVLSMVYMPTSSQLLQAKFKNTKNIPEEIVNRFQDWAKKYNKLAYFNNPDQAEYRLQVYYENFLKIQNHPKTATYTLGENQFMDLTKEEFKTIYLGLKVKKTKTPSMELNLTPKNLKLTPVDWTQKGAVTPIKDQGQCGSCWSFSTTGGLEGTAAIFGSGLQSFSEEQLVQCSSSFGNQGCNGGLMDDAFKYVIANGITTEQAYPYTSGSGTTGTCQPFTPVFKISSYTDVPKKLFDSSCTNLQAAVAQQPVSIGVDAEEWQFYQSGVFSNCGKQLDHGVLAVGYDASGNWKVKNSWGTSWGVQGFITLAPGNTCGICNTASYPSI